ncbi:MAG: hypothetical protein DRJ35_01205 [Thermoprotei archaeon]|nr:MAG: hypothetical protein DRJ35_01205 [Thermoprotei archaeon]
MKAEETSWIAGRKKALNQLQEHMSQGRVDEDIIWLLNIINSNQNLYTTSSCSGRIQVAASPLPGDKGIMRILAKWHRKISPIELELVVTSTKEPNIWFAVHPPIFHIAAKDLETAKTVLNIARNNGFKHSGIQGMGKRYIVEIMSMEKLETPLRLNGIEMISVENYPYLVDAANKMLEKAKNRLKPLGDAFLSLIEKGED